MGSDGGFSGRDRRRLLDRIRMTAKRGKVTDTIEALVSDVKIDGSLPSRLISQIREAKAAVKAADERFKPEVLEELVREASKQDVQKKFAIAALQKSRSLLKDYKQQLDYAERRYDSARTALERAKVLLDEEQTPMVKFLVRHAPENEGVKRLDQELGAYSTGISEAKSELQGLGELLSSSRAKEEKLAKEIESMKSGG